MKKLSSHIKSAFATIEGVESANLASSIRASQVRKIWSELVEETILDHTNGVYILKENGTMVMKVYVDESIYAAELNNRRELIQLLCKKRYGEMVDGFQIYISRGLMKKNYPFRVTKQYMADQRPPIALSEEELRDVEAACAAIENEQVREKFKKAMIADLEWKKGNP